MNASLLPGSRGRLSELSPFDLEGPKAAVTAEPSRPKAPLQPAHSPRLPHRWRNRTSGEATVSIHVRELAQLSNSLDPSPMWDRDLERGVAEFIEDEFRDRRTARAWRLKVYAHESTAAASGLQSAISSYYRRLAKSARLTLREHLGVARIELLGGALIFLISTAVRSLLENTLEHPPLLLDQGLIILAWLGLWRPTEALVYGWVPFYRRRRLFERLARVHVVVRGAPPENVSHGTRGSAPAVADPVTQN